MAAIKPPQAALAKALLVCAMDNFPKMQHNTFMLSFGISARMMIYY
jgi:hypothetical protein